MTQAARISLGCCLALSSTFVATPPAAGQDRCGVDRWPVKVGIDADAWRVDTVPIPTTVAELVAVPRPAVSFPQRNRVAPIELQTFLLRARLGRISSEDDSDIHVILRDLEDERLTLVAEIPHPGCVGDDALGLRYDAARRALRGVPRDGLVEVIGIGFFDFLHGQAAMASNGLEIHPVTYLRRLDP